MFDIDRILAIPDESVDYFQMGISGGERAALAARGFVRKDGTKAKDYMIRTIQKTEKNKAKAEKAVIKGDKKLPAKVLKGVVPDSIPSNVVLAIQEVEREKIKDKFLGTINPSTQKFNETYQVVPTFKASENSKNTYQKAQSIAKENGWDWDGIVKKVAKEDKIFDKNDMRRMKELRTRSNLLAANEKKQSQFMAQNDLDVAKRSSDKPMVKTESAQKARTPIGGRSFNVKGNSNPASSVKARSRKIDKADVKNNLALGDKVVLASANKSIPASVESVKKINKNNIVVERVNSVTGKPENKSIPIDSIAVIQKKNGKNVSVKGNSITGNLSVEQKQFRNKTGKPKTQPSPIAPDTAKKLAITDKKSFQSEGSAAKKIKGAIASTSATPKSRKVVKGESPDTRNAGYINYGGGKAQKGKIRLVDYRNKDVNAYVAKLNENGDRRFIKDHGKTDPNSYKGKENVKEWNIRKLEDGVYEANSRQGIGTRGVEKSYFSVKKGKIDNYFDNYQQAKEVLTPKEKRINKTSLSGSSEKQISYAESVRDKAIAKLQSKGLSPSDIQKAISDPQTQTARWWLDNKDNAADKIYNAMLKQKVKRL